MNLGLYTSPLLATILYRRGYLLFDSLITMAKVLTGLGLTLAAAYCFRGLGRANNAAYLEFEAALNAALRNLNKDTKVIIKNELSVTIFEAIQLKCLIMYILFHNFTESYLKV